MQVHSRCLTLSFLPVPLLQVKAAFTRAYNKEAHLTPYSLQAVRASRHSLGASLDSEYSEDVPEEDSQSDEKDQDAIETDAMIKVGFAASHRNGFKADGLVILR